MATLTAAQISYLRDNSGDDCNPYDLADETLQAIYDDTAQGNSDLDRTIVYALRRRLGKAAKKVALSGEFGNASNNQLYEHIERLLKYWEGVTGLGGAGVLTAGVIDYDLDEPCPDGMTCDV